MNDENKNKANEFIAYADEILNIILDNFTIKVNIFADDLEAKLNFGYDKAYSKEFIIGVFELLKSANIITYKDYNGHCFSQCGLNHKSLFLLKSKNAKSDLERILFNENNIKD